MAAHEWAVHEADEEQAAGAKANAWPTVKNQMRSSAIGWRRIHRRTGEGSVCDWLVVMVDS